MVSNTSKTSAEGRRPMLEEHGILKYFDEIILSSEVDISKPDPEIFFMALEKLKIPGDKVLHIGDSIYDDVNGAKKAGLTPVLFDPLNLFSFDGLKIKNLLELIEIVDKTL